MLTILLNKLNTHCIYMLRAIFFDNGSKYPEDRDVEGVLIVEEKYISQIIRYIDGIKTEKVFTENILIKYCKENNIDYLYFNNEEEYSYD